MFVVYFRTGGTENFKWQFASEIYTREQDIAKVAELAHAGYPAHYDKFEQIAAIGLPETFA